MIAATAGGTLLGHRRVVALCHALFPAQAGAVKEPARSAKPWHNMSLCSSSLHYNLNSIFHLLISKDRQARAALMMSFALMLITPGWETFAMHCN